jgi:hypothetical protein
LSIFIVRSLGKYINGKKLPFGIKPDYRPGLSAPMIAISTLLLHLGQVIFRVTGCFMTRSATAETMESMLSSRLSRASSRWAIRSIFLLSLVVSSSSRFAKAHVLLKVRLNSL